MKKLISVFLSAVMLSLTLAVSSGAREIYPESDHSYPDNASIKYEYTCPDAENGMFVKFSSDTYFEDVRNTPVPVSVDADGNLTVGAVLDAKKNAKSGDWLSIYSGTEPVGRYTGSDLASASVFVGGDTLTLLLESDGSENYYGFRIESIVPAKLSDIQKITYHTGLEYPEKYERIASCGETLEVDRNPYNSRVTREGYAFAGWAETPDGTVAYRGGEVIEGNVSLELYAVWCPTYLERNEVFWFTNSKNYFTVDEKGTYYMTQEDMDMLQQNIFKTFGPTPVPGIALGIVLSTYPNWNWRGSCYGISTVTALQHYGLIDVKSLQNADDLVDMDVDSDLISYINYYQANAATSWLCENKAVTPGTVEYAASMEDMFESVKNGNVVLYTFYSGNAFVTPGHTVLLTGAYENAQGNHIFVAYDCNHAYNYTSGRKSDRFVLSPDFRYMTDNSGDSVGSANWTDTYSQFDSFSIDGSGKAVSWYSAFFAQLRDAFVRLFSMLGKVFGL